MAKRQKEWQNGRMAEMATYVLFMVHTNDNDDDDDDDDNDDNTLIFYITEIINVSIFGNADTVGREKEI